MSDPMF